ncbi:hypothetical protein K523DRAFT_324225 [Schizophyllum commune Tattone D]|nr:hypothetical protein K523DRAFT_324225 [Schizophyllum commune Tattone D]
MDHLFIPSPSPNILFSPNSQALSPTPDVSVSHSASTQPGGSSRSDCDLEYITNLEAWANGLYNQNTLLVAEKQGMESNFNVLLARIGDRLDAAIGATVLANPAGTVFDHPPIITLNRADHPNATLWFKDDFKDCKSSKTSTTDKPTTRGKKAAANSQPIPYITDCNGRPVRGHVIRERAAACLQQLFLWGLAPRTWGTVTHNALQWVIGVMEDLFPILRLCEGHWKLILLISKMYSGWMSTHLPHAADEPSTERSRSPESNKRSAPPTSSTNPAKRSRTTPHPFEPTPTLTSSSDTTRPTASAASSTSASDRCAATPENDQNAHDDSPPPPATTTSPVTMAPAAMTASHAPSAPAAMTALHAPTAPPTTTAPPTSIAPPKTTAEAEAPFPGEVMESEVTEGNIGREDFELENPLAEITISRPLARVRENTVSRVSTNPHTLQITATTTSSLLPATSTQGPGSEPEAAVSRGTDTAASRQPTTTADNGAGATSIAISSLSRAQSAAPGASPTTSPGVASSTSMGSTLAPPHVPRADDGLPPWSGLPVSITNGQKKIQVSKTSKTARALCQAAFVQKYEGSSSDEFKHYWDNTILTTPAAHEFWKARSSAAKAASSSDLGLHVK